MADRMMNQRPANEQSRNEERGLARWEQPRGLSSYRGGTSPFELMRRFSEDVDRIFSSLGFGNLSWPLERTGRELARPGAFAGAATWAPSVDVYTRGDDLVVSAELPGIKPEDVEIEAEDNNLIIRGESRAEREDKDQGYWYSERSYGSFYRSIPLPQGVKADDAQARFNNGVLEITLPGAAKSIQPQRRRIQIQGAQGTGQQQTRDTGERAETTTAAPTGEQQPTTTG